MVGPCPYSRSTLSTLNCRQVRIANVLANTLPVGLSGMDSPRSGTGGAKQGRTIILYTLQIACDLAGCGYSLVVAPRVPRVTGNVSKMEVEGSVRTQECYVVSFLLLFMDAAAFELIHLIET